MAKDNGTKPAETKGKSALEVLEEARKNHPDNFNTGYWPDEESAAEIDGAPIAQSDGRPRRYFVNDPGEVISGYYLGCEVLNMPKFGHPDLLEEKAFFLLEVCEPKGFDATKYGTFGVKVRRPRTKVSEIAVPGDVVYVGVRKMIAGLALCSGFDFQPHVMIRVAPPTKTARNFNLSNYEYKVWETDRPHVRILAGSSNTTLSVGALFGAQDAGLYAARYLFDLRMPDNFVELAEKQRPVSKTIVAGDAPKAIGAGAEKAIPANVPAQS